ncbi:hypothetical protein BGX34_007349 [Mortierella sp. NVP85]|nr:hypothetical protein BGX34_007349 [Mortierella sp. NVP85]
MPSSAASAAIESLLPSISVSKKKVPGKSAEIVRASITLPGLNEQTDLEDWRAVLECAGARKIWDQMVESSTVLMTLDDSTCITKTIFKTNWPASPRDALLIETTLLDHNAVLHIATSIKPSEDDPIFLRPSPPHVRAYLPLVVWHIQLVPAEMDDTISFTSFTSLSTSQNKPVMPRHSIRVSFYYQLDMRGWAVNSSVSMQSHVPSCIANVYRLLRRQGVPPHVSRHSPRIQLDLNEYDPATGIYELRYDVIPLDSDSLPTERRTIASALRQFRLGSAGFEDGLEPAKEGREPSNMPHEVILSDDDEMDEMDNENAGDSSLNGYVDVELDGEKWGKGSDVVVHIFMNDIEDEEFVREHVECLKYMGRDRYILRMKHTEVGTHHGAINVKLLIKRIPQHSNSGGTTLSSYQQLRIFQEQDQGHGREQEQQQQQNNQDHLQTTDLNGLSVSVNGHEKNIVPLHRSPAPGAKRGSTSLQEHLDLGQQIVHVVDESSSDRRGGSDALERVMTSPLLLMSSSMSVTMQSLGRSNQSILSNGTSTMAPGNSNPSKVNSSYNYFSSLLQEPAASWKALTKQRGVQISKLEAQGHAPGIVKGEGVFEDYTIWDIKGALDCVSARKIWDKMFEDSHMLQQVSPSSILSYVRLKGFWPTSPKDMAVLNTTFVTKETIHYFGTSVDDTNQYPSIPPPQSPFVRSELVVSGWYLETIKPKSVRITYIAQATQTSWMVPGTALGAMTTEIPLCVAEVIKYLETHGSPPTLISIRRGRALTVEYSDSKSPFRLEYVPDSSPIFSGRKAVQQQQSQSTERNKRNTIDFSTGTGASEGSPFGSPKLGPTEKLLAEIRLDARTWARNGDCEITIDPPPSKVLCSCVPHDGTGYRLRIEHGGGRAVPAGGKVLLMARRPAKPGCGTVVNGVAIKMPPMDHLEAWLPRKDRALTLSMVDGVLSEKENQDEDEDDGAGPKMHSKGSSAAVSGEHSKIASSGTQDGDSDVKQSPAPLLTPLQYAQDAMDLLTKIKRDPEDAWTVVSDTKGGMKVTKRFMPAEISDQVPLVRGEKVIEGFSLEEIATVIGTLGTRAKLDDLFDSGEMLESFGAGCAVFHHVLRSYFPLPLPARDLFFITTTASVEASARCPQIVILSTSIPPETVAALADTMEVGLGSGTSTSKSSQARPRAHLHLSAWILEGIDPYSSSHPIPSTRVTYMTALDLGGSVPQRISAMLQTGFPKMITQVESYLQLQAAPPIVRIPEQMVVPGQGLDERKPEKPFILPPVWPWSKPANRILSWEFKLKDSFCQLSLLFDQFRLCPSRLDLAEEKRMRKNKKARRKSKNYESAEKDSNGQEKEGAEANEENTKNHTILELVVDLKQYPLGYNIMTNIKVDPEFLLQQKQQRDSILKQQQQQQGIGSISSLKFAGSASSAAITTATSSSTKFIGGFDSVTPTSDNHLRSSIDGEPGAGSKAPSSEAASTGTGIAAVLGSSATVPRSLPSSTSLIRILPPPVSIKVVDIPPAPSHSSSLSGVSKQRKHLIIITVPEAEHSISHVHAQQQGAGVALPKGAAPHIISGTTAKPVVTASSANGTTTAFSADDRADVKQGRQQLSSSSTNDANSVMEAVKPFSSPGMAPTTPDFPSKRSQQPSQSGSELETRMFQFGLKIDRLVHKDLDHAALAVAKESPHTTADEKEWSGKVMVDGLPVKVLTGWSRHELGFLDGMMEDDGREQRRGRRGGSSARRSSRYSGAHFDQEDQDNESDDHRGMRESGNEDRGANRHDPRSSGRKKKHHQQQLSHMNRDRRSGNDSLSRHLARNRLSQQALQTDVTVIADGRPTSSMYGLSSLLMNVGLLGYGSSRISDNVTVQGRSGGDSTDNGRRKTSTADYDEDDDSTIRASKSVSRGRLSGILDSSGSKKSKFGDSEKDVQEGDHDLDLESLHGSIVLDQDDSSDNVYEDEHSDARSERRTRDREASEWTQRNGSIRRKKGKGIDHEEHSSMDNTTDTGGQGSDTDLGVRASSSRHRGRSTRSSMSQHRSRRHVSTNGADHPRFRGSKLYAYTFRHLVWMALACFLMGLLLRVYVIGPSFLKTVGSNSNSSSSTTYYYYFHAPRTTVSSSSSSSSSRPLQLPSDVRELLTVRRVFGWDLVLLAYPSSDEHP